MTENIKIWLDECTDAYVSLKGSEFKLHSCDYIYFLTNTLEKGMNLFIYLPQLH